MCRDTVKYVENTTKIRNNSVNKAYKQTGINKHKCKYIRNTKNGTKGTGNKHNREQMILGINVQCIVKVYKNKAVRESMTEIRVCTVQNTRVRKCTGCVQMYNGRRRRTRVARVCKGPKLSPAVNDRNKSVCCAKNVKVNKRPMCEKKSNLAESVIMNNPMNQEPTGSEIRPGFSGTYMPLKSNSYICTAHNKHRLGRSYGMYKVDIQCSSWHKDYGE
jgi:hypothetical protein